MEQNSHLNKLLSTYQVFYQSVRGFHWNIVGNQFFELHQVYQNLYEHTSDQIDMIAEQIRMNDDTPLHDFQSYLSNSLIQPSTNLSNSKEIAFSILDSLMTILNCLAECYSYACESGNVGLEYKLEKLIAKERKHIWFWKSFIRGN